MTENKPYVANKQRIWNIVKANPGCSTNFVKERLKDVSSDIVKRELRELVSRDILEVTGELAGKGRPQNIYRCVEDKYWLKPAPKVSKHARQVRPIKIEVPTPDLASYTPPTTLPGIPVFLSNKECLLEKVKAAPFGEVREIYTYLKEMFRD